ncbi:MAG: phosphodiester glycosidase family protein [Bacteroidota bacterium]|nr:phosphodiester glycosidase family protein [Bacteroidota bacterium]
MRILIFLFLICLFTSHLGFGQYKIEKNVYFAGKYYDVFILRIDTNTIKRLSLADVNGGKFNNNFFISACISDDKCNPLGLFVTSGDKMQEVNLNDGSGNFYLKPNGALLITKDRAVICESSDIKKYSLIKWGVQNGPMLLNNGAINPQFTTTSPNQYPRSGVGLMNEGNNTYLVFAKSNAKVTYYELSTLFLKKYHCLNALHLESSNIEMNLPHYTKSTQGNVCHLWIYETGE